MQTVFKLTHAEEKLAELLWGKAPIGSRELTVVAEAEFDWKRTTTLSVLKRLIEKGIAKNDATLVTTLITREEFITGQSRSYIENSFDGSLPKFITSFIGGATLTPAQAAEIRRLVDTHEGGK